MMETKQPAFETNQVKFGPLQIGIVLLTLATAFIHGVVLNILMGTIDPLFTLNGLGFLGFLAALYLPIPIARDNRNLVRWAFIAFTAVSILAWVIIGDKSLPEGALGYVTKLIEAALLVLLWIEGRR
jgi:uncharacterized membrane protein YeiH